MQHRKQLFRVTNWYVWNKRKKQASGLLFFTAFALMCQMEATQNESYGYFGVGVVFVAVMILNTVTDW